MKYVISLFKQDHEEWHLFRCDSTPAEPFKIPTYANQMTRDATLWTQNDVKPQKM